MAGTERDREDVVREILALEQEMHHALGAPDSHAWLGAQVTVVQLRALFLLGAGAPLPLTAVAEGLGVSAASASETVDRLVRQRLVTRERDPVDRRRVLLRPTAAGRALVDAVRGEGQLRVARLLGELETRELTVVREALVLLKRAAERVRVRRAESDPEGDGGAPSSGEGR